MQSSCHSLSIQSRQKTWGWLLWGRGAEEATRWRRTIVCVKLLSSHLKMCNEIQLHLSMPYNCIESHYQNLDGKVNATVRMLSLCRRWPEAWAIAEDGQQHEFGTLRPLTSTSEFGTEDGSDFSLVGDRMMIFWIVEKQCFRVFSEIDVSCHKRVFEE